MKKVFLSVLVAMLILSGGVAYAAEPAGAGDLGVAESGTVSQPGAMSSIPDQNTEEVQLPTLTDRDSREYMDEYILALSDNAQAKIKTLVTEIEELADRSDAAELQKKIEKIKLEEEIARLYIRLELVKDSKNQKLAAEIEKEIAHLETIDQPVIGIPKGQPVSDPETAIKAGEVSQ